METFKNYDFTTFEGQLLTAAILYITEMANSTDSRAPVTNADTLTKIAEMAGDEVLKEIQKEQLVINQDRAWEIKFTGHYTLEADTREQAVEAAMAIENKAAQIAGLTMYLVSFYQCLEGLSHEVIGNCEASSKPIFQDDDYGYDSEGVMWLKSEMSDEPGDEPEPHNDYQPENGKVLMMPDRHQGTFQQRVYPWLVECFGLELATNIPERCHRFLEESLELVQSLGATIDEANMLVNYVYGRPVGEPAQEVGGVMVTLAALNAAAGLDMHHEGDKELARIWGKIPQIREKQATKPNSSPLPGLSKINKK